MTTHNLIRQTVERFFDGETSVEEERKLYAFYMSHPHLPANLEQYRPLISDLGCMSFEPIPITQPEQHTRRRLLVTLSGIAASLLLYLSVSYMIQHHEQEQWAATYEGSYVIQNGKRIDDLSLIKTDIEHALGQAETIEMNMEKQDAAIDAVEEDILSHTSPEERAQIEEMLK